MTSKSESRIKFQIIPRTTSGINCRSQMADQWPLIRKEARKRANSKCEICGDTGDLHCHEVFEFLYQSGVQKLVQFQMLCVPCHMSTHPGYAGRVGEMKMVFKQLRSVNKWKKQYAIKRIEREFRYYREHTRDKKWKVDLSYALNYLNGILQKPKININLLTGGSDGKSSRPL